MSEDGAVRLSTAVMTHPRRLRWARELAGRLPGAEVVTDPEPDRPPNPLRTATVAWGRTHPAATHHAVFQDDVAVAPDILEIVAEGAARFPGAAVGYYANWDSRNGAAVRLAGVAGASWVRGRPEEYTPTLALCLPAPLARRFAASGAAAPGRREDDEAMSVFLREQGCPLYLPVPTPVEHLGGESIAGMGHHGVRRSACFAAEPGVRESLRAGAVLERVAWIPYFRAGRGPHVLLARGRGPEVDCLPWEDALPALGVPPRAVREPGPVRDPAAAAARRAVRAELGEEFAGQLRVHGFLVGWQAAHVAAHAAPGTAEPGRAVARLAADRAAGSLGIAAVARERRAEISPGGLAALAEWGRAGVHRGRRARLRTAAPGTLSDVVVLTQMRSTPHV
ncbi:hypothetical protein ACFW9S_12450 [Streptomyces anulatus]|uniref:hypothetical protein n=1 Tax=Streptomyces anulatus TaxID=1892 RepID=UPI003678A399